MKKIILSVLVCGLLYVTLSSSSHGIAGMPSYTNRTGSDGGVPGCDGSGCHQLSSPSNLVVSITIINSQGNVVSGGQYTPNTLYTIKLHGHITGGSYPKYGFQFSGSGVNDGTFTLTSGLLASRVIAPYEIIEQTEALQGTAGNNYDVTLYWQSPPTGSGAVTFYLVVLGANNDGFNSGDVVNATQRTLTEGSITSIPTLAETDISIYPNPVSALVNISMRDATPGTYLINVYNLSGQRIVRKPVLVTNNEYQLQMDASSWNSGMYVLELIKDGSHKVVTVIKE